MDTVEYEPPMTPLMGPVVLNFSRGVPPPLLHSYLKDIKLVLGIYTIKFFVRFQNLYDFKSCNLAAGIAKFEVSFLNMEFPLVNFSVLGNIF